MSSNSTLEQFEQNFEDAYHRADLQDVMEQGEIGEMIEANEERNNVSMDSEVLQYNDTIASLRRSCVSKSSTSAYTNALVKMILWMYHVSLTEEYIGYDPLTEFWKNSLALLQPEERKEWIKQELKKTVNAPINFETFEPGKCCKCVNIFDLCFYLILTRYSIRFFSFICYGMQNKGWYKAL